MTESNNYCKKQKPAEYRLRTGDHSKASRKLDLEHWENELHARVGWVIAKQVARSSWGIGKRVARSSWGVPKQPTARSNDSLPIS